MRSETSDCKRKPFVWKKGEFTLNCNQLQSNRLHAAASPCTNDQPASSFLFNSAVCAEQTVGGKLFSHPDNYPINYHVIFQFSKRKYCNPIKNQQSLLDIGSQSPLRGLCGFANKFGGQVWHGNQATSHLLWQRTDDERHDSEVAIKTIIIARISAPTISGSEESRWSSSAGEEGRGDSRKETR